MAGFKLKPLPRSLSMSIAPPACLSAKSKRIWSSITGEFSLTSENLSILQLALEHLDLADIGRKQLRKDGLTVDGKKNPVIDSVKLSDGFYLRALRQLGLDIVQKGNK